MVSRNSGASKLVSQAAIVRDQDTLCSSRRSGRDNELIVVVVQAINRWDIV
jgi:hypothetical protein